MKHVLLLIVFLCAAGNSLASFKDRIFALRMPRVEQSDALRFQGSVDHASTWVADSTRTGNPGGDDLMLHTTRLMLGVYGELPANVSYNLLSGASFAANSLYEQRIWTPELQGSVNWQPHKIAQIGVFGRYGWRRPNAFMTDSLRRRDAIAGLRLGLRPHRTTDLSLSFGNRMVIDEDDESHRRFFRGELKQRVPFWESVRVRLFAESDWYGLADSLDFDQQRSLGGVTVDGLLPYGFHLYSYNAQIYRDGVKRWVFHDRVRGDIAEDHHLALAVGTDWTTLQDQKLFRRHFLAQYDWDFHRLFGLMVRSDGDWIELDGVDTEHRREIGVGPALSWHPFHKGSAGGSSLWSRAMESMKHAHLSGHLLSGYRESLRYGNGVAEDLRLDLNLPVEPHPWLRLNLRESLNHESFYMLDTDTAEVGPWFGVAEDDVVEWQRETRNQLGLETQLFPSGFVTVAHRMEWRRKLGTELVFDLDTLQNTVSQEVWMRMRRWRQQLSLSGMMVDHVAAPDELNREYRLSTSWSWRAIPGVTVNARGVWRPARRDYTERLWTRAFVEAEYNQLRVMADFRFDGDPENIGDRDTQFWVHVVRRLW